MADSIVENLSSSVSVQQQQQQQQPSTSHISVVNLNQILTSDIRVENNNNISSQPSPPPPPIQQQQSSSSSAAVAVDSDDIIANMINMHKRREEDISEAEEPHNKRQKVEIKNVAPEKLEVRLSGILCCAVCLDLPKHSIYQVIFIIFTVRRYTLVFCYSYILFISNCAKLKFFNKSKYLKRIHCDAYDLLQLKMI